MRNLSIVSGKLFKIAYQQPEANNSLHLPFADSPEPVQPDPENLIQVPLKLRFHSFDYIQVCRGERTAVYHQTLDQESVGYEVFIIQMEPETTLYGKFYPAHERWPRDGDLGKKVWSCWNLEEAMVKYNML
jgi:hypothetical protein